MAMGPPAATRESPMNPLEATATSDGGAADRVFTPGAQDTAVPGPCAYVPRILLESLARHPDRQSPWCERVEGTLLMGDVSGFTAMSESLAKAGKEGAESLTDIINSFFGDMLGIASEYGGDTMTFGGDAVLLLFRGEGHARRACAAALTMLGATARLRAYKVGTRRVRLGMSMGAHSGEFFVGSAGLEESRLQCILFGPGAARTCLAEAAASSGELLVTQGSVEALAGEGRVEPRDGFFRVLEVPPAAHVGSSADMDLSLVTPRLLPYVPPAVGAASAPDAPPHAIESDHRKVCVAFINIMGVDELLGTDGPASVLGELQDYVAAVVRLADRYGGYLVSNDVYTLGLKLIVCFGAPVAHEHDTANALRMVLALRSETEGMGLRLPCRIGLNSGFVFGGDVGPAYRRQYTVMGDAVNLAARLMSAAGAGEAYLSTAMLVEAGPGFVVERLDPIAVKGKQAPIPVGALLGERDEGEAGDGTDALVGRDEELRALEGCARQALGGHGAVAIVRGEPGIGKSRLTRALRALLDAGSWDVMVGGCQSHTSGQPFALWAPPLRSLMGITPADGAERKALRIRETVRDLLPDAVPWIALLGPLLGATLRESDAVRSLKESEHRERLFSLMADLLGARAARTPVALVMEDLHWADASSLALLERVVREMRDARVLVVATSRLEPPLPVVMTEGAVVIELEELPAFAAARIVSEVLGREDLPAEMARLLFEKTRGNPLLLQEVARSLAASGVMDRLLAASGSSLAEQMAVLEIPDRVQGLLMSRIDALPERTKEVLRVASVIGATFERSTLSGVLGATFPSDRLDDEIAALTTQSLADPEPSAAEPTFRFRHALIQEVAYDSLKFSKRRALHQRIAEHLEQASPGDLEPLYETLVHHYSAARDDGKTRFFAVQAAGKARRLFAHDEAVAYYRRAMTTVRARTSDAAALRSLLEEQIGNSLEGAGRSGEAADVYIDALRRWERARRGTRDQTRLLSAGQMLGVAADTVPKARDAAVCCKIGLALSRTDSDYDLSLRWLERAMDAVPPGQSALRAQITVAASRSYFRKGDFETSMTRARKGLVAARRAGDRATQARALGLIAGGCFELDRFRQSIRYDLASLPLYLELDDLWGQGSASLNLGTSYAVLSMLDKALEHFQAALDIWTRIGNVKEAGLAHVNMAEALIIQGEYDPAIDHLLVALSACGRTGAALWLEGFARLNLARAYLGKGALAEADMAVVQAVACLEKARTSGMHAEALLQRAEIELAEQRIAEADATCTSALDALRALGMKRLESRGLRVRGRIQAALGEDLAAEGSIRRSLDLADRAGDSLERGLGLLALAELYAESDDSKLRSRAQRRLLHDAAATLTKVGARTGAARARELAAAII